MLPRKTLSFLPLALSLLFSLSFLSAAPAQAQTTVDFESFIPGTTLSTQVPGVIFHGKPKVELYTSPSSGTRVLHTYRPGAEFHPGPLAIEFTVAQNFVGLRAGLMRYNPSVSNATLTAYDAFGNVLVTDVHTIAPGPNSIAEAMSVSTVTPQIRRVELQYQGSLFEAIDDLTFSTQGPPAPADETAPVVAITQPVEGATFTTDDFLLSGSITEENLDFAELTISWLGGSETFRISTSGPAPNHTITSVWVGDLQLGTNVVSLSATDLSGNVGSASVVVTRDPVDAELTIVDPGPWEVPRTPGVPAPLRVRVSEVFPGSLDGSSGIRVEAVAPSHVYGIATITDPDTTDWTDIDLRANSQSPLGLTTITLQAIETSTGTVLDSATIRASLIPANAVICDPGALAYYQQVDRQELERSINEQVDTKLAGLGAEVFELSFEEPELEPDADVGLQLTSFTAREAFVDQDGNGSFSIGEPVYADVDGSGTVSFLDFRLKNPVFNMTGSVVVTGHPDDGETLTLFPADQVYVDLNSNGVLDRLLREPIYRSSDATVNHGDIRLADALVKPSLAKQDDLTVHYMDNFNAPGGLLRLSQQFWGINDSGEAQADIIYQADLRIHVVDGPGTNITFSHYYLQIATTGWWHGLPVGDGHGAVQEIEDDFEEQFANALRDELGAALELEIEERVQGSTTFLQDGYFTDHEFGLGFCLLPGTIPSTDDIPGNS